MKDKLNSIKKREWYRPVAPIVCQEDFGEYFEGPIAHMPFMTLSARMRESGKRLIPAACHVDGSARVQTVTQDSDPFMFALLKEYKRASGTSVLLNTSYNFAGEPIVETPLEAITGFIATSGVDCLLLDGYCLEKIPAPSSDTPTCLD